MESMDATAVNLMAEIQIAESEIRLRSLKIKRWLRTDEVALYLGTSPGAIRNMVMRKQLTPKKCFGRNYFDRDAIDGVLERSASPPDRFSQRTTNRRSKWR